jgi:predicted amidohydrolase
MTSRTDAMIRLGTYQGPVVECDPAGNTETALSLVRKADDTGLNFLCLPEAFLTGYSEEAIRNHAIERDGREIRALQEATAGTGVVVLVGAAERTAEGTFNSQFVVAGGELLGVAHKTMLTRGYDDRLFETDLDLPVFEAHGVRFGVAICHTTSFVEPALYLRWRGARILFTPHFNDMPPVTDLPAGGRATMWDHRRMVLNNQAALATLLKMIVVRSNVVKIDPGNLGSGDAAIWGMDGEILAAGTPFTDQIVTADVPQSVLLDEHWIDRREVPVELLEMTAKAAKSYGSSGRS